MLALFRNMRITQIIKTKIGTIDRDLIKIRRTLQQYQKIPVDGARGFHVVFDGLTC